MKNKILVGIATGMFAVATVVGFNLSSVNGAGLLLLDDIAVMAKADDGESGGNEKICSRIKSAVSCYRNSDGMWAGMSITACEDYVWKIPMQQTTCQTTDCPSGSSPR
jgi:hypothetical protein